jgi:hypothetical protein
MARVRYNHERRVFKCQTFRTTHDLAWNRKVQQGVVLFLEQEMS